MNFLTIKYIATAFSMKNELKIILLTFFAVSLLPILAVVLLTQVGINIVSGALVTNSVQAAQVDIHDPITGLVVDNLETSVVWPINGPVTLEYGETSPYQLLHTGIDIASPNAQVGDPVVPFMKGKVIYADTTSWGFGKHVEIDHGHHVTSIYAHLDSLNVKVGDEVDINTIIGTRGNTGWSTGPHLHFQINVFGIPVNPRIFLAGNP